MRALDARTAGRWAERDEENHVTGEDSKLGTGMAPDGKTLRLLSVSLDDIDDHSDVDERLATSWRAARLGPTVERLRRHVLQGGERSIEAGQFRALDSVAAHGPCAVRELAVVMGLEPSSVTRALAKLEASNLIRKRRSPADKREVLVELTDSGRMLKSTDASLAAADTGSDGHHTDRTEPSDSHETQGG